MASNDGAQPADVVAKVLGISVDELRKLSKDGVVIKVGNDKYNLLGSVRAYTDFLRNKEFMPSTQKDIAAHLDMSDRNARDVLRALAEKHGLEQDWWKKTTLADIRVKFIRDQREKAAGRGGKDQENLTKQRAAESEVKTATMVLEYNEKIGSLVSADDVAAVITEWCSSANREYLSGVSALIGELKSVYKIDIDNELVDKIVSPTISRIKDHAEGIGKDLNSSGENVFSTEEIPNSGVDD